MIKKNSSENEQVARKRICRCSAVRLSMLRVTHLSLLRVGNCQFTLSKLLDRGVRIGLQESGVIKLVQQQNTGLEQWKGSC
jgi:hypothetical protein